MKSLNLLAVSLCMAAALGSAVPVANAAQATRSPVILTVFAAGTLAAPFRRIDEAFETKYPNIKVEPRFAGSVKLARQMTDLHEPTDLYAAADYSVIQKYLMPREGKPGLATWYIGFARNAITFVYTDKSKFSKQINGDNWYEILARPGVEIGRSDPDTDPSGYQMLQMLDLASAYYHAPKLAADILANSPRSNIRDTETSLLSVLEAGEIDYLAIYRSDALQHHLKFLTLPDAINLGDPEDAKLYASAVVHTRNGDLAGKPIVYALTIPSNAPHPEWAERYAAMILGPTGRMILGQAGFEIVQPAYAVDSDLMPSALKKLTQPWPAG